MSNSPTYVVSSLFNFAFNSHWSIVNNEIEGDMQILSGDVGNALVYDWTFEGGVIGVEPSINWIIEKGGDFVLRVEDTDKKREIKGSYEYIEESLRWCGLPPDESPSLGGDYGPYKQSERRGFYKKYIENEPSVVVPPVVELPVVAAESAEPEIDHEENVALKLNQAYIEKTFSGRRAPAISCW